MVREVRIKAKSARKICLNSAAPISTWLLQGNALHMSVSQQPSQICIIPKHTQRAQWIHSIRKALSLAAEPFKTFLLGRQARTRHNSLKGKKKRKKYGRVRVPWITTNRNQPMQIASSADLQEDLSESTEGLRWHAVPSASSDFISSKELKQGVKK